MPYPVAACRGKGITPGGVVDPRILYDTFTGSGALAAHTPEIYPAGSSWAIYVGTFQDLSGGYARYNATNYGRALINSGIYDIDLTGKWRCSTGEYGCALRSNADGTQRLVLSIMEGASKVRLYRDAYSTELTPVVVNGVTFVAGTYYTVRVVASGGEYRFYVDGAFYGYGRGTNYLTNTYVGLGTLNSPGSNGLWDELAVSPAPSMLKCGVIGDSISAGAATWPNLAGARCNNGLAYLSAQHAVSGHTVMANMDAHVAAAAADDCDHYWILLGVNDNPATDVTAEYQENLIELAGTNTRAKIYALGILNTSLRTAEQRNTRNSQISTAAASAAEAGANVTYWNTDDWIDPATDTTDGLHPNAAGTAKVVAQVLARMP